MPLDPFNPLGLPPASEQFKLEDAGPPPPPPPQVVSHKPTVAPVPPPPPRKPSPDETRKEKKLRRQRDRATRMGRAGHQRLLETPLDIINSGLKYLEWCEDNPISRKRTQLVEGVVKTYDEELPRIPTVTGWAGHIGTTHHRVREWRLHKDPNRADATNAIVDAINTAQIEGSAVGIYHAGIAGKLAGLIERTEGVIHTTPTDTAPETIEPSESMASYLHPDDVDGTGPRLTHDQWLKARAGELQLQKVVDVTPSQPD